MQPKTAGFLRLFGGAMAGSILGWAVAALYAWFFASADRPTPLGRAVTATIYPNLILVPMAMGVAAAWVWRPLKMTLSGHVLGALVVTMVCLSGAALIWGEGVICLIVGSPILYGAILGGCLLGRLFSPERDKLQLALLPFLIALLFIDGRIGATRDRVVEDRIEIAAPAAEVWQHVVAFPRITTEPDYWLNKVGLPSAAETTCEGEFVGAKRECIFSNGLVFKEVVSELEPARLLTFEVVEQPNDPELLGHLTLHRGQFELRANPDDSTTLLGRSWYTLHVRPLWYFDWWTRDITREVHLRVMRHIKQLSEAGE